MSKVVKSIIPFRCDLDQFMAECNESQDGHVMKFIGDAPYFEENLSELREFIKNNEIHEPSPFSESSIGFASIEHPLNVATDGHTVSVVVERRERLLPKDVIARMTAEKVRVFKERTGDEPSKGELRDLKDEAKDELMPKAMVRARQFPVTIEVKNKRVWIMMMNCSGKTSDRVYKYLCTTIFNNGLSKLISIPADNGPRTVQQYLRTVLRLSVEVGKGQLEERIESTLHPALTVKLKHPEYGTVTARSCADEGFETAQLNYAQEGYEVCSLGIESTLTGEDSMYLNIADNFRFYGFSASPSRLEEQYATGENMLGCFLSEAFVFSNEVRGHIELIEQVWGNVRDAE